MTKKHPCHSKEISRINRAIGQLEGIKRMISDDRYCIDILAHADMEEKTMDNKTKEQKNYVIINKICIRK